MKIKRYIATGVLAAALSARSGMAQTVLTNGYTNTFPNGGATSDFSGGGTSVASWLSWYSLTGGPMSGDPTNDAGGDPTSGSLYVSMPFTGSGQQEEIFGTFDNQYGYDGTATIPLNIVTNVSFDIYVDPATTPDGSGNYGSVLMSLIDSGWTGGGRTAAWTNFLTIPAAANGHWVHMSDSAILQECLAMQGAGFTSVAGIGFYFQSYGGYPTSTLNVWIDNITVQTSTAPPPPPPPPTVALPAKTVQGLNVFFSTGGGSDRQEVELNNNSGLSWVGQTGSGPVSYSFTISSFPNQGAYSGEAYLFLIPNPAAKEGAPDYNEANCAVMEVQRTATGAQAVFQYKVNDANDNGMIYNRAPYTNAPGSWDGVTTLTSNGTNVWAEEGTLTNVQSATVLGTWTLTFTTDTNGMLVAPDGTIANFAIPSYYITNFAAPANFNVYLGGQADSSSYLDQAVVFSNFAIAGLGASDMNETFVGETALSSAWTNIYATGPAGVLIVPPTAPYWISWSTPAIGYSLINSGSVGPSASWKNVSTYSPILMYGTNSQLISSSDLINASADYFRLVKRTFSQLLVLLPGQTNTPGVAPGYTGTPTALSLGGNEFVQEVVTVLAVDSQWNPIAGVNDTITLVSGTGSDPRRNIAKSRGDGERVGDVRRVESILLFRRRQLDRLGAGHYNRHHPGGNERCGDGRSVTFLGTHT